MVDYGDITLTYNAKLGRARAEFPLGLARTSETALEDALRRVAAKLAAEQGAGRIAHYVVRSAWALEMWRALGRIEANAAELMQTVGLDLGHGSPDLPGVTVVPCDGTAEVARITIDASPALAREWRFHWLCTFVEAELAKQGQPRAIDRSCLRWLIARVRQGDNVWDAPLPPKPTAPVDATKPFTFVPLDHGAAHALVINDFSKLGKEPVTAVLSALRSYRDLAARTGPPIHLLEKEVAREVRKALQGPERLGIDVPVVVLAAIRGSAAASRPSQVAASASTSAPAASVPAEGKSQAASYPGKGWLDVAISPDKMTATIRTFDVTYYDQAASPLDEAWLYRELARFKLGRPSLELNDVLVDALRRRGDLTGLLVAQGIAAKAGAQPELVVSRTEAEQGSPDQPIDWRERAAGISVTKGELVASIRYRSPPVPGRDIFGQFIPPPQGPELEVALGEGIEQVGETAFYASMSGTLVVGTNSLAITRAVVVNGDVNLVSGNVHCAGDVEIKGTVEAGALVEASGNVIIEGGIRGGVVRAGGNVVVKGGIVTGERGLVICGGDLHAQFIENSLIRCRGSVTVQRAILNSQVAVSGDLQTTAKDGRIAGGELVVGGVITTENLGFEKGARTTVQLGRDWRHEQRLARTRARVEAVEIMFKRMKSESRELSHRQRQQLTKRHDELKHDLHDGVTRAERILERLAARLSELKSTRPFSISSAALVSQILAPTVAIEIDQRTVKVPSAVRDVGISALVSGHDHMASLETVSELLSHEKPRTPLGANTHGQPTDGAA